MKYHHMLYVTAQNKMKPNEPFSDMHEYLWTIRLNCDSFFTCLLINKNNYLLLLFTIIYNYYLLIIELCKFQQTIKLFHKNVAYICMFSFEPH